MKQARAVSEEAKRRENINVRAAFIHVIGDFIQSLGVFIAALIIYFYPHLVISFIKLLSN
jgi:Co/Zn/Cd efflux system component